MHKLQALRQVLGDWSHEGWTTFWVLKYTYEVVKAGEQLDEVIF